MLRQTNDPGSPYYAVFVTPLGLTVQYRQTFGGATTVAISDARPSLPVYLQIQRQGDVLQAATSADGSTYTNGARDNGDRDHALCVAGRPGRELRGGWQHGNGHVRLTSAWAASPTPRRTPRPRRPVPPAGAAATSATRRTVGNQSLSGNTWTFSGGRNRSATGGMTDQFHYVWTTTTAGTSAQHADHGPGRTPTRARRRAS